MPVEVALLLQQHKASWVQRDAAQPTRPRGPAWVSRGQSFGQVQGLWPHGVREGTFGHDEQVHVVLKLAQTKLKDVHLGVRSDRGGWQAFERVVGPHSLRRMLCQHNRETLRDKESVKPRRKK